MASILERRIKGLLDDVIDVAFSDETGDARTRYKNYDLYILSKENSSSAGMWHAPVPGDKAHRRAWIDVYNPSLGAGEMAGTFVHELSHQVDWIRNGTTGHKRPFYEAFEKLIHATLDMGILTLEDYEGLSWGSHSNKVKAIVEKYVPKDVCYRIPDDAVVIKVYNCFPLKDLLKQSGYGWNGIEQTWEKEVTGNLADEEKRLAEIGVTRDDAGTKGCHYAVTELGMYVDAPVYLEATGNTYEKREELKKRGFFYRAERKSWLLKVKTSAVRGVMEEFTKDSLLGDINITVLRVKK